MTNFEAMQKMTPDQLAIILDNIFITGMNNARFADTLPEGSGFQAEVEKEQPYNEQWLNAPAEHAVEMFLAGRKEFITESAVLSILRMLPTFPKNTH